ncbi:hypothetical protein MMC21_003484 [Puttea exsequens]|nr:hypothetical protein [Puttea exsequens]
MPFPKVNSPSTGKAVFIWGRKLRSAGFEVITTCFAHNFEYVKSLGVDLIFDYSSTSAINDIAPDLDKGACIGIFQAAGQVAPSCQVTHESKQKLFVAATNRAPEGVAPEGVETEMVFASVGAVIYHETSPATSEGFLPETLAKGL